MKMFNKRLLSVLITLLLTTIWCLYVIYCVPHVANVYVYIYAVSVALIGYFMPNFVYYSSLKIKTSLIHNNKISRYIGFGSISLGVILSLFQSINSIQKPLLIFLSSIFLLFGLIVITVVLLKVDNS